MNNLLPAIPNETFIPWYCSPVFWTAIHVILFTFFAFLFSLVLMKFRSYRNDSDSIKKQAKKKGASNMNDGSDNESDCHNTTSFVTDKAMNSGKDTENEENN